MKKRRTGPASASSKQSRPHVKPDPPRPFVLVAGIWEHLDRYWPTLTWGPDDPAEDGFCAIKSESRVKPTNAALIALLDIKKAEAVLEPICTETEARLFMSTIGYTVLPGLNPRDVTPADDVRESDETGMNLFALAIYPEVEEYIRIGDPPIVKETFDRLTGMGLIADQAIGLICKALTLEFSESGNREITPESIKRVVQILTRLPELPDED